MAFLMPNPRPFTLECDQLIAFPEIVKLCFGQIIHHADGMRVFLAHHRHVGALTKMVNPDIIYLCAS
jgi:hypothetical protein